MLSPLCIVTLVGGWGGWCRAEAHPAEHGVGPFFKIKLYVEMLKVRGGANKISFSSSSHPERETGQAEEIWQQKYE